MPILGVHGLRISDRNEGRRWDKTSGNNSIGKTYVAGGGKREAERAAKRLAQQKAKADGGRKAD